MRQDRKRENEERLEEERRQRIYDDAMMRIHAYRAGEVMANLLEEVMQNGSLKKS